MNPQIYRCCFERRNAFGQIQGPASSLTLLGTICNWFAREGFPRRMDACLALMQEIDQTAYPISLDPLRSGSRSEAHASRLDSTRPCLKLGSFDTATHRRQVQSDSRPPGAASAVDNLCWLKISNTLCISSRPTCAPGSHQIIDNSGLAEKLLNCSGSSLRILFLRVCTYRYIPSLAFAAINRTHEPSSGLPLPGVGYGPATRAHQSGVASHVKPQSGRR